MNALMTVSNRLFTAALADKSGARRRAPRSEKEVIVDLARRELATGLRKQIAPPSPSVPKMVRFDSRLGA